MTKTEALAASLDRAVLLVALAALDRAVLLVVGLVPGAPLSATDRTDLLTLLEAARTATEAIQEVKRRRKRT